MSKPHTKMSSIHHHNAPFIHPRFTHNTPTYRRKDHDVPIQANFNYFFGGIVKTETEVKLASMLGRTELAKLNALNLIKE